MVLLRQILYPLVAAALFEANVPAQPQFVKIDYPGQPSVALIAINASGQIVGLAPGLAGPAQQFSFLMDTSGHIGASIQYSSAFFTYGLGIDNAGNVVGTFSGPPSQSNVFLRSSAGTFTLLPLPTGLSLVFKAAISGNGAIVLSSNQSLYFQTSTGSYVPVVVPGAGNASNAANVTGIDNAGNVVGFYYAGGPATSFYRSASGNFQAIFVPGSSYTEVQGMNNLGQAVGFYYDGKADHGFLWRGGTDFTTIDYPGAVNTFASGINDSGVIVGFYDDATTRHGMIYYGSVPAPTPTPAPPAIVLASTALVALAAYQILRRLGHNSRVRRV